MRHDDKPTASAVWARFHDSVRLCVLVMPPTPCKLLMNADVALSNKHVAAPLSAHGDTSALEHRAGAALRVRDPLLGFSRLECRLYKREDLHGQV